jgi:hypothetical protein
LFFALLVSPSDAPAPQRWEIQEPHTLVRPSPLCAAPVWTKDGNRQRKHHSQATPQRDIQHYQESARHFNARFNHFQVYKKHEKVRTREITTSLWILFSILLFFLFFYFYFLLGPPFFFIFTISAHKFCLQTDFC